MDIAAFERALDGRSFTVLSVCDELPEVLGALRHVGLVEIEMVPTKAAATSLIRNRHYNLLVVEEKDDWDDVRGLLENARAGGTDSIVVKGAGIYNVDHLRALFAGADSYVPIEAEHWRIEPKFEASDLPRDRLATQLRATLSPFGEGTSNAVLEQIRGSVMNADADASDLPGAVARAARDVDANHSEPIAEATLPQIEQLLQETASGVEDAELGVDLHWNVRFPDDAGILRNAPHIVSAGGEYPFETVLESTAGIEGYSPSIPAAELEGRKIAYELAATNGMFQVDGEDHWDGVAVSDPMECTADGTPPFRVIYRPGEAGTAIIQALLLVDGGSIARQTIELNVVGGQPSRRRRKRIDLEPIAVPATAIAERADADLRLFLTPQTASLWMKEGLEEGLKSRVTWREQLPDQVVPACREAYAQLSALSKQFAPGKDLSLLGRDGPKSMLDLARIGNLLHRRVFEKWKQGQAPRELVQLADLIRNNGNRADPPQLQLITLDYPLPWGVVYDQPIPKRATPSDIDPNGFWGVRYDIYRNVVPSDMPHCRGTRCRVKPIVGKNVPLGDQQLAFVKDLAAGTQHDDSEVFDPSSSQEEIRAWATRGDASDLLYLYCHAIPMDKFLADDSPDSSSLAFGATEQDPPRVTLRQLRKWWNEPRQSHPVVILNACASGKSDAVLGAPFVDFFTRIWSAQAFIGTDWPVAAPLAHVVGQALVREICEKRLPLRAALRYVINKGAEKDNYFPLMYAIYGSSDVRFSAPAAPRLAAK